MKKTQREPVVKIDEFEDLTLFANESFDTLDVDLFEFSREESSPLTRLKSIILSLDWEINDEILQELADELQDLDGIWADDKVAQVYLQGLSKIGGYLRAKGAYAHPNSIKLLLSFFYNFEKIISSQTITGEEITTLLKGDVRKFRILQYQINQSEGDLSPQEAATTTTAPLQPQAPVPVETDDGKQLKAAILSLDWEVTDDSLNQFSTYLSRYQEKVAGNKWAMVLTQGLQALGDYIGEEKANAHSEAFILLHSFNDALEQVAQVDEDTLDPGQKEVIENILVDQINRLNNLKLLIAAPSQPSVDEQLIDEVVDRISTPAAMADDDLESAGLHQDLPPQPAHFSEDFAIEMDAVATDSPGDSDLETELDTLFALDDKTAMESADVQYPDEILPPDAIHPVDDELADTLIGAQLSDRRGIQPALADADELAGFNEDAEPLDLPAQSDLVEQLDFLFSDFESDITTEPRSYKPLDADTLDSVGSGNLEPVAALADVAPEDTDIFTDDTLTPENDQIPVALADVQVPEDRPDSDMGQEDLDRSLFDIQDKLDHFFTDTADESPEPAAMATDNSTDEVEQALFFTEENGVESALADSEEERGFSEEEAIATLSDTPLDEIEEKLDFFFGSESDEQPERGEDSGLVMEVTKAKESSTLEDEPPVQFTDEVQEEEGIAVVLDDEPTPALADIDDLQVRAAIETPEFDEIELDKELEGKLDLFFDAEEIDIDTEEATVEMVASAEAPDDALTKALEATLADEQPATVELSVEEPAAVAVGDEDRHIHLAALGALLPGIVRTASREQAAESTRVIEALNDIGLSAEHQSLLQMLQSVISLLARLPARDGAATEKLVNYIYEQLLQESCPPEALTTAVQRFTTWLQDATALMPQVPTTADATEDSPRFAYTAQELYFELIELRAHIKEEFAKIRHEMHHHKS
jgi:pilus assembly protein FimV